MILDRFKLTDRVALVTGSGKILQVDGGTEAPAITVPTPPL